VHGDGAQVRGPQGTRLRVQRDSGVECFQRLVVIASLPESDSEAHEPPGPLGDGSRMSQREGAVPLSASQASSKSFVEILRIHRLIHRSGSSSFPKTPEFLSEAVLKLRPDADR
jgi:hypothetical protein